MAVVATFGPTNDVQKWSHSAEEVTKSEKNVEKAAKDARSQAKSQCKYKYDKLF